jgi:hypothetical protein
VNQTTGEKVRALGFNCRGVNVNLVSKVPHGLQRSHEVCLFEAIAQREYTVRNCDERAGNKDRVACKASRSDLYAHGPRVDDRHQRMKLPDHLVCKLVWVDVDVVFSRAAPQLDGCGPRRQARSGL